MNHAAARRLGLWGASDVGNFVRGAAFRDVRLGQIHHLRRGGLGVIQLLFHVIAITGPR